MKKTILAILAVVGSVLMAVFTGKTIEQRNQAKRDKEAQQKAAETYRDAEEQFNKDVKAGKSGDPRSHFE